MVAKHQFSVIDIVIFALCLMGSAAIGVWFAIKSWRDSKKRSTEEYLMGSRNMQLLPMVLSLMSSVVSGILILAYPAEIYTMGAAVCWTLVGGVLALVVTAIFYVPVIHNAVTRMKSVSVYAYLEKRFNSKIIRIYVVILFTLNTIMYMSVVLYAPSVALAGVTTLPTWALILTVGVVCTIYTTIGGLKAVVWADSLQALIMYAGLITMVIRGSMAVGGGAKVWQIAKNHSRTDGLTNFDPNPFQYMTVWTAGVGGFFFWVAGFGSSQFTLQRYCSMKTQRQARLLPIMAIPFLLFIGILAFYLGFVVFAFYSDCDPVKSGQIKSRDQLVIYFMIEILNSVPGLPGLFLSCLFSGTLSTVSTGINALSAISLEEFVKPCCGGSSKTHSYIVQGFGVVYGVCAISLAFAAGPLGGVFQAVNKGLGTISGPLLGVMTLGVLVPWANKIGTIVGMICGTAVPMWIFLGATLGSGNPNAAAALPLATHVCDGNLTKTTLKWNLTTSTTHDDNSINVYALSIFMYTLVGGAVTVLVGFVTSMFTGGMKTDTLKKLPGLLYWNLGAETTPPTDQTESGVEKVTRF